MYVVAYRAKLEDDWCIHKCKLSGRILFDGYAACFKARWYCQRGNAEAQVLKGSEIFARFYRTSTGSVVQEGGVNL